MSLQAFFDNFALLADAPNGIGKLRELILGLAFRGKLVPQLPDEGTAGLLVEEIESVKSRLQSERDIPKTTRLPSIAEDEVQHEIPSTWLWARLGEVVAYDCSQKVSAKQIPPDAWLLELEDIEKDSSRIIQRFKYSDRQSKSNKARFVIGDVLYGKLRPYLNKVVVADAGGYCTTEIVTLRGYYGVEPKFLMYALKRPDFVAYINEKSYGTKMPRLGSADARLSVIPLPPLGEQKRIVDKVDELMRLCDEVEGSQEAKRESRLRLSNATLAPLNRTPLLTPEESKRATTRLADNFDTLYDSIDTVAKLRSTILQLAIQGRLVVQDPNDQPSHELLKRIQSEIAKHQTARVYKSSKPLPPLSKAEQPFLLPPGWQWTRLRSLVFILGDGLHGTPEYAKGTDCYFVNGNNFVEGRIVIKPHTKTVSSAEMEKHKKPMTSNTVLVSINGTLGNVAFYNNENLVLGKSACYFNLASLMNKHFMRRVIESPYFIEYAIANATGTTIRNLGLKAMNYFPVPVPPLEEQKRIVSKVNELMSLCDELEAKLHEAEGNNEKLMNAAVQHVLQH